MRVETLSLAGSGERRNYLTREKVLIPFVVVILLFCVFMFLTATRTINRVSAVEAKGVGVYWDSNCSDDVSSIDWGTLSPGSRKNIGVYVRNEEVEQLYLILSTKSWNPPEASNYMILRWNYTGQRMNPNQTVQITLTLSVSRNIEGISNFDFDITITGSQRLPGDADGSGRVVADDFFLLVDAFGSRPEDSNWNPNCDFDNSDRVSSNDFFILVDNFGEEAG
ncbi:MAG: hypothetical protein JSV12_02225 [Candidatus Bathyarchaeota archaeon]|nr:MAG: hypothetical protein JSV12_02225 [Candidatus Bathyarchaeota archaeon]